MLSQASRLSLEAIRSHKLRSFLSMLGVTIGVFAVVALVSLGQSVNNTITGQFQEAGSNFITITIVGTGEKVLTYENAMDLHETLGVKFVAPAINFPVEIEHNGRREFAMLKATTPEYIERQNKDIKTGSFFEQSNLDEKKQIAVLDEKTIENLISDPGKVGEESIGENIAIQGIMFNIAGVLRDDDADFDGPPGIEDEGEQDNNADSSEVGPHRGPPRELTGGTDNVLENRVLIPLTTATEIFGINEISVIYAEAEDIEGVEEAANNLETKLHDYFGDEDAFNVFSQNQILDLIDNVTGTLTSMLAGLAGISLLVGGIGIMNIMLVSVTERTREIGISKALGAKRRDILMQFMIESVVISGIGGVVGIILGYVVVSVISNLADLSMVFSLEVIAGAILFSMLVGVFFGIYPANKAAKLNPIDALRSE
ncbi:ABC transporter permease [Natranaerofaba carboxydovora]|uniref:ABC transporter permease n=1 Tax=Natranaerofaba carboxydovora TaxID=2742683 RepID=UPI001F12CED9|nr:ABC transporter permease [Natranaerofaba carboxydovora]UMZ72933.1 Macrolide export ATP-binding/permease protein MacB [Natranaerofaba carboxydovora]